MAVDKLTYPSKDNAVQEKINEIIDDYVDLSSNQNITGVKTFVGQKKIGFKQSGSSDKLGFTLYNNSGIEKGYLEYNPSNLVDSVPLMTLGNYTSTSTGLTHVGFRKYSSISGASGAYNLLAPLISDARTPFNLTTTYTNFYLPLGFSNGTTTVTTAKTGVVDLSSLGYALSSSLATVATSGQYSDLTGTPTIPTVNNATLTITQGGVSKGTFTANASSDVTIELDAGGGSSSLAGLSDVSLTALSSNQVLAYDGSEWANSDLMTINFQNIVGSGNLSLADTTLSNVSSIDSNSAVQTALNSKQDSSTAVTHTASTAVGDSTTPVYINSSGAATALSYTIAKSVPSNAVFTDTTYSNFTGATSITGGAAGLVPAPSSGDNDKILTGGATWSALKTVNSTSLLGSGNIATPDTKNTAGSTDTSSKIFLIGATSQATNPQTYSQDTAFVDTDGRLNSAAPANDANDTTVATTKWVKDQGYSSGITVDQTYDGTSSNPQSGVAIAGAGFLTGITSGDITSALGYTPYSDANPDGYITSSALSGYIKSNGGSSSQTIQLSSGGGTTPVTFKSNSSSSCYLSYYANSTWVGSIGVSSSKKPVFYNGSSYTLAYTSDIPTVNNATLTIQKNGTTVNTFTANASTDVTADITVPVNISDLTDDTATYPIDKADTLTGLTASITELNYTDGVTSNIQTQLDGKLSTKPDGTNNLIDSNNKVNISYMPDVVLGQMLYAGTFVPSTAVATLSTNAKTILGTTSDTITLTNDTSAITGYTANEGNYYIASGNGTFASISFLTGDWLVATADGWGKILNTDAVTGVKGNAESTYRTGNVNITADNVLPSQSSQSGKFLTTNGTTASWADIPTEIPSQSGNSGKFLTTNGSAVSWDSITGLPSQTSQSGKYLTTNGTSASWVSLSIPTTTDSITSGSSAALTSGGAYTNLVTSVAAHSTDSDKIVVTKAGSNSTITIDNVANATSATSATTASKLGSVDVGSATQPIFLDDGVATACTYSLGKSVPSDAVFTDTTYSDFTGADSVTAGASGLVPAPSAGDNDKILTGGATWSGLKTINSTSLLGSGNIAALQNNSSVTSCLSILGTATSAYSSINIGFKSNVSGVSSIAIGAGFGSSTTGATASGENAVAIGSRGTTASGDYSIAIGSNAAQATGVSSIQLGYGTNSTANTLSVGFCDLEAEPSLIANYQLLDGTTGYIPNARINMDTVPGSGSTNAITSGAAYTALADKVNKSGDTMTGGLTVQDDVIIQYAGNKYFLDKNTSANYTNTTAPGSDVPLGGFVVQDVNGKNFGGIALAHNTSNNIANTLYARRSIGGAEKSAYLTVYVDSSGNGHCSLPQTNAVDGEFVALYKQYLSGESVNGTAGITVTLSDLPSNDKYFVLLSATGTTSTTSGQQCNVMVRSTIITDYLYLCRAICRQANNSMICAGAIWLPVQNKTIYLNKYNTNYGSCNLWLHGYRRIGTNS